MKRRYSSDFSPPAPVLPVRVASTHGPEQRMLEGKIDCGADLCAVPEDVVAELDLAPVRIVRTAGFQGAYQETMLYQCAMELAGRRFKHVEAVATKRRYAIVGRNLLRHFRATLDGPMEALIMTSPARGGSRRSR